MKSRACCKGHREPRTIACRKRSRARSGDAGSFLRRRAAGFRSHQPEARRPEAGVGLRAGARQRRQGAHRAAGTGRAGSGAAIFAGCASCAGGGEVVAVPVHRARGAADYAAAGMAGSERCVGAIGAACQPAHAATQLRHAHGGERRRSCALCRPSSATPTFRRRRSIPTSRSIG